MENNFENALSYITQLRQINTATLQDDKALADAFVSYSAKTNKPTREMLVEFAKKFREWEREWDLFSSREVLKKPKSIDEFISELLTHT